MKTVWKSVCMAFALFSVFPAPNLPWKRENMQYMLCALPLVGCIIGVILMLCNQILVLLGLSRILRGAVLTALPAMLSGGIHLDGFCDTADALASHAEPDRKREIMKDSHAGAFAVIAFGIYLLLHFASCCSLENSRVFFLIPVLSRSVGAFGGTVIRNYDGNGLLSMFREGASDRSGVILFIWISLCLAGAALVQPVYAVACAFATVFSFLDTRRLALKQFGGMSGDLAGYLNAITELTALLFCAVAEKIGGVL